MSRSKLPTSCRDCPLGNEPHVQGWGVGGSPMILGEAPGHNEVKQGIPFIGMSGRVLRETLSRVGLDPEEIYITNSVLCHPPGNETPTAEMLECCSSRLVREVKLVQPTKILCVGGVALTAAYGAQRVGFPTKMLPITKWRGRGMWTEWSGRQIYTVPTYHPAALLRTPDLFRDFARDVEKWATHDAPIPKPKIHELICTSPEQVDTGLQELIKTASKHEELISCDLETTGFSPLTDKIISTGFGCEAGANRGLAIIIPARLFKHRSVKHSMHDVVSGTSWKQMLGGHNLKFDLQFLDVLFNEHLRPPHILDSMLLSYLLDERPVASVFAVHGLKAQARIRYDADDYEFNFDKYAKLSKADQKASLDTMYSYQAQDLYYTAKLCSEMANELAEESPKLREVHDGLLIPALLAFTEIELHGTRLDFPHLTQLKGKFERESKVLLQRLQRVASKYGLKEFNPASAKQVGKLLYDVWKMQRVKVHGRSGNYTALSDRHGLDRLKERLDDGEQKQFIEDLLEYRAVLKELNTYVTGFMELAKDDERIHANFQLAGTATGRLSSWHPNLQNIPVQRGNHLRNAFIASDGMNFVAADFSQLEVRVAAALSGENSWVEAFRAGRDLHRMVGSQMLNKPEEDVTELERRMAKTIDFGILYGLGAKGLVEHEQIHKYRPKTVTLEEWHKWWNPQKAEEFLNLFKTQFPKLIGWMDESKRFALKNHYVEAVTGRRRRFPFIPDRNTASRISREAANMPIQSAASDICLQALIKLHRELPQGAYVLFSVHDAIYVECEKRLTKQVEKQVKETMIGVVPEILGFVPEMPFDVKVEVGSRWAEGTEDWSIAMKTGKAVKDKRGGLNGATVAHVGSRAATR